MEANANTITTMGLISSEVYDNGKIKKYFIDNPKDMVLQNGTTYKVLDHTGDSTLTGFQALLLQEEGTKNYVIAFRGTELLSLTDWIVDLQSGIYNYNAQLIPALNFVNKALNNPKYDITIKNLTLTGHSLGGILTQAVFSVKSV